MQKFSRNKVLPVDIPMTEEYIGSCPAFLFSTEPVAVSPKEDGNPHLELKLTKPIYAVSENTDPSREKKGVQSFL